MDACGIAKTTIEVLTRIYQSTYIKVVISLRREVSEVALFIETVYVLYCRLGDGSVRKGEFFAFWRKVCQFVFVAVNAND